MGENTRIKDLDKKETLIKWARTFLFAVLLIIVVGVAFMMYLSSKGVDIKSVHLSDLFKGAVLSGDVKQANLAKELKFDPKEWSSTGVYKGSFLRGIRGNIKYYNAEGQVVWDKTMDMNSPSFSSNSDDLVVFDRGGKDIYAIRDKDIKWYKKLEGNIQDADLGPTGHLAVTHEVKGYKGAVTVFNPQGGSVFSRNIAEDVLVSAKISPSGKLMVINGITASGAQAGASLEVVDMKGNPLQGKITMEDEVFGSIWYFSNDEAVAVSDTSAVCLTTEGVVKWSKDLGKGNILSSAMVEGKNLVLAVKSKEKDSLLSADTSAIIVINGKGDEAAVLRIEGTVANLSAFQDVILINAGREAQFINIKGKMMGKLSVKSDILKAMLLSKKQAVAVTKTGATLSGIQQ